MPAKLEVRKIEQNATQTTISWARLDTERPDWGDFGSWTVDGNLTPDEVLSYAKTMADADIEVLLNLQ